MNREVYDSRRYTRNIQIKSPNNRKIRKNYITDLNERIISGELKGGFGNEWDNLYAGQGLD